MKNKIWLYPLLLLGFVLILTNGCKKKNDELPTKKNPVITWENPADIIYGTLLKSDNGTLLSITQLNATADVPGTFVYTPPVGTKLNVGANQDLRVDFTPTDAAAYNIASKTVKINVVAKSIPVITWATPADITNETILSATQLNATANVAGTLVYTPAAGTKLNVGANQVLKVLFTPTNTATIDTVSKTVKINVTQATTVADADGNIYNIITIGTQLWMAENLKTTKYNDSTAIPKVLIGADWAALTTPAYCWYDNAPANKTPYGALYNWYTVGTGKLCPTGWHVPTDAEWTTLITYLGGESVAGSKIKETGTTHWKTPNSDATNESGFTAVPGGLRNGSDGICSFLTNNALFWSNTQNGSNVWNRIFVSTNGTCVQGSYAKKTGLSVRCIKN
jgi:uncharacterized protein (TIGR02145 family)